MDSVAKKYPRFLSFLGNIHILTGFLGMIAIVSLLIVSLQKMIVMPIVSSLPPIMPLLPWIKIPGFPTLYFSFWIISLFILAVVHESSHGIFARLHNIKLKASGFGFFGPLPLAFVEPDEKELAKKSTKAQLSIFAAGPGANFITALVVILLFYLVCISPAINPNSLFSIAIKDSKVSIVQIGNGTPAQIAGLKEGDIISIDGFETVYDFSLFVSSLKPNQTINISVDNRGEIVSLTTISHPLNSSRGYLEITITPKLEGLNRGFPFISGLLFWILMTNIFVGLFNLMPFWIVDGGRIFYTTALHLTKSKKKSEKAMKAATFFCLFLFFLIFFVWILKRFILI